MPDVSLQALAQLLQYCESFAQRMLGDAGDFYAFGAFVNGDGQIEALAGHLGTDRPNPQELYRFIQEAIVGMAAQGKLSAYAVAANVNMPGELGSPLPDGIRVHVEAPGYSRLIYTPFRLLSFRPLRKFLAVLPTVQYAEQITVDTQPSVFASRTEG
jgi:hypothetical protein